jgi:hypothetical protein
MDGQPYPNPRHILVTAGIAVAAVLFVEGAIFGGGRVLHNLGRTDQAAAIDDKIATLNVEPRTIELTSEKATRVRNAIKNGDFTAAREITTGVLAESHLQNWRYYPFDDFINDISDVNDPAFENQLNAWVAVNKNDVLPLLIRAQYYFDMGWFKRGHGYANEVQTDDRAAFQGYLTSALADIDAAIRSNDRNPYSFYLELRILLGLGMRDDMQRVFEHAIAKYPSYYQLYSLMVLALEPKWGGTVQAMYAFVDQYVGNAPNYSPLKLLYLSLYKALLDTASNACSAYARDKDRMAQCVASVMQKLITPTLEDRVLTALQLYDHSDHYQFGLIVEKILFDMLKSAGGERYSGALLQLAATAMHSDTQLAEATPTSNDYVIDKAVSESWYLKGFYDNALKKDEEALKDVQSTAFPSEEDKDLAVAGIYEDIGGTYNKLNRYAEMIANEQAALALGNITAEEHFICYGYLQLKDNDGAVRACTKTLENQPDNLQARYWRGHAYRDLGQTDAALQDLTIVAGSESYFRTYAAIDMSMIYFGRNDDRAALDVLNKYKYLYDPATNNREGIAVSYNNRCYAYMQLGELKEALEDCTASLKFGSIPDAFRKQQELVRRLNAHEEGL